MRRLIPVVNVVIEGLVALVVILALLILAALLNGCTASLPIGENAKYGRVIIGYQPPPSLTDWADSPSVGASDFKEALQ